MPSLSDTLNAAAVNIIGNTKTGLGNSERKGVEVCSVLDMSSLVWQCVGHLNQWPFHRKPLSTYLQFNQTYLFTNYLNDL